MCAADDEWLTFSDALDAADCAEGTLDWHIRAGRIETKSAPHGRQKRLYSRSSLEALRAWLIEKDTCRADGRPVPPSPPVPGAPLPSAAPHGARARYRAGCRCRPCMDANAAYSRRAHADAKVKEVPEGKHGTAYAYGHYGCRCEPCTRANSVKRAPAQAKYLSKMRARSAT